MSDEISISRTQPEGSSGYDRVFAFIREQMVSGRLATGQRLLPERELANALGVSRPVVREALRALSSIGAVEIRPGHGTVVRRPDLSALSDFFTLALAQEPNAIDDIMEVRIAIERHAARLACQRASEDDLTRLVHAFEQIVLTVDDVVAGWRADFDFHLALVAAARSPTLSSVYGAIADMLKRSHLERRERIQSVEGIAAFLIDHHGTLMRAILDRDEEVADRLLVQHFEIGAELRRAASLTAASRVSAKASDMAE